MRDPATILITGASSGIGAALARRYAADGIALRLTGRNAERLARVAADCRDKGADVETAILDVTDAAAMAEQITTWDAKAPFDLVVANAGISAGTGRIDVEEDAQVRAIFDTNLYGVLNTLAPVIPAMLERGCGQVALLSSIAGFRGLPSAPAYTASKAAVRAYGEALRPVLKPYGVTVSVVSPGFVRSGITDANTFKMPLLMEAAPAADLIARKLAQGRGRIAFPFPTYFVMWLLSVLPPWSVDWLLARAPKKT